MTLKLDKTNQTNDGYSEMLKLSSKCSSILHFK